MKNVLYSIYKVWCSSFKWPLYLTHGKLFGINSFRFRFGFLRNCYRERHYLISAIGDHELHRRLSVMILYTIADLWPDE